MKLTRYQRPDLFNWGGFGQMTNLRDEINRLFDFSFNGADGGSEAFNVWAPALDVLEDKDNLVVRTELPGMKKEEIDISLHDNIITISGERKQEKKHEGETSREERFFGRFTRSMRLPKAVDVSKVKAVYLDGILTVTLPKAEDAKPRQIQINT